MDIDIKKLNLLIQAKINRSIGKFNNNSDTSSWMYYTTTWSIPPMFIENITGGSVYSYTLEGTTRYRFVPSPYSAGADAFYSEFSSPTLSGLIVTRG